MLCKICGADNPETAQVCSSCGASLADGVPRGAPASDPLPTETGPAAAAAPPPEKKGNRRIIPSIIGMISGLIAIWTSFQLKELATGEFERNVTYGGDAYTGIQNAAAQTANNVQDIAELVQFALSGFLLAFGVALFAYFLMKLVEER